MATARNQKRRLIAAARAASKQQADVIFEPPDPQGRNARVPVKFDQRRGQPAELIGIDIGTHPINGSEENLASIVFEDGQTFAVPLGWLQLQTGERKG